MAWIERTKGGYRVVWREGGRASARKWRGAPDKRTADALKKRIERDLALHGRVTIDDVPDAPPALHARLDAWLDALTLSVGQRTVTSYGDAATLFLRYLTERERREVETLPVNVLDRDAIVGFAAWLTETKRAPSTVAKRVQAIRLAWEWLCEGPDARWLDAAPRRMKMKRPPRPKPVAPTWDEADRALLACWEHDPRAPWLWWFAVITRCTGLRRSEVLLLQWTDLGADGVLDVRAAITKGESSGRRMPLAPVLIEELARLPRVDAYVVPAPPGERVAADGDGRGHVDRNMRRAWTRAGVDPAKWKGQPCHAFRKTIQTELELSGVRREVVEYLVGHQPEGTGPKHYLEVERALWPELVEAVKKIPALPARPTVRAASKIVRLER